jgi:hypothetical protein
VYLGLNNGGLMFLIIIGSMFLGAIAGIFDLMAENKKNFPDMY